jgi:putative oligomerization/nucleic acid binding protein
MVVIFGWGAGDAQDLGEVAPVVCPNCHNDVFMRHIRSEKRVSLYFIPLVPYGSDQYLACPICMSGLQVRPEQRPAIERMRETTAAFRRGVVSADSYRFLVDQFWTSMGVALPGQPALRESSPVPGPPPAPSVASPSPSLAGQLAGFARLHDEGILTDEEFAAIKRRLLAS